MPATDVLERHARRLAGKSWPVFMRATPNSPPRLVGNVIAPDFNSADVKSRRMYGPGAWVSLKHN